jgi:hypothetical protein
MNDADKILVEGRVRRHLEGERPLEDNNEVDLEY